MDGFVFQAGVFDNPVLERDSTLSETVREAKIYKRFEVAHGCQLGLAARLQSGVIVQIGRDENLSYRVRSHAHNSEKNQRTPGNDKNRCEECQPPEPSGALYRSGWVCRMGALRAWTAQWF
jgi:hypothetical protein